MQRRKKASAKLCFHGSAKTLSRCSILPLFCNNPRLNILRKNPFKNHAYSRLDKKQLGEKCKGKIAQIFLSLLPLIMTVFFLPAPAHHKAQPSSSRPLLSRKSNPYRHLRPNLPSLPLPYHNSARIQRHSSH